MNKIQALFDLTNQVALVTGGAGGLGKYYTQALLIAVADVLKVPLGHVLLIGIIVAIPTIIISGPVLTTSCKSSIQKFTNVISIFQF